MGKEYKIDILPRVLEILGPNMYTNIYYIIGELIANSYDADAREVYIFIDSLKKRIRVEDNGIGMSYEDFNKKYLSVGLESRKSKEDEITPIFKRKRMGRKGIGKLAALSVSNKVQVMSISAETREKSGCILTKDIDETGILLSIPENSIKFKHLETDFGTIIELRDIALKLHKTVKTFEKNINRVFPITSDNFRITISVDGDIKVLEDPVQSLIPHFDTLKLFYDKDLSNQNNSLDHDIAKYELQFKVPNYVPSNKKHISFSEQPPLNKSILLKNKKGEDVHANLSIKGWIATYSSTKDYNKKIDDFADYFISLYSNRKMGIYSIIPEIGKNSLYEVYVAAQFHIELFEDTNFPDMALSNRQGYRSEDPRYKETLEILRKELEDLIKRKTEMVKYKNSPLNKDKYDKNKTIQKKFDEVALELKHDIYKLAQSSTENRRIELTEINRKLDGALALKSKSDDSRKQILISHTSGNSNHAKIVEKLLHFCGINPQKILFTSSDDLSSILPHNVAPLDYIKDFFVDTYSDLKPFVIFICSEEFNKNWNTALEAGAMWITQKDHQAFYIYGKDKILEPIKLSTMGAELELESFNGDETKIRKNIYYLCNHIMDITSKYVTPICTVEDLISHAEFLYDL